MVTGFRARRLPAEHALSLLFIRHAAVPGGARKDVPARRDSDPACRAAVPAGIGFLRGDVAARSAALHAGYAPLPAVVGEAAVPGGTQASVAAGDDRDPARVAAAAALVVAGIGFRPGCTPAELAALLAEAARLAGCAPSLLAVPWMRAGETAALVADGAGLPLVLVARDALLSVQDRCPTRSNAALRAHGVAAVAEGCALAAAGAGATLLLPRIASRNATCAIAGGRT